MNRVKQAELKPGYKRLQKSEINGERTRHVITFNPNKANPGEEIYISVPRLKPGSTLVPDKMFLVFDFKNANTKSWFNNNLAKQLQKQLKVKFAGEIIYDNSGESLLRTYEDLWICEKVRANMVEDGIATENQRKVLSKSDDATADKFIDIYGTKQRIRLEKILTDHGFYAPYNMSNDLQFIITLPPASEIMKAQSSQTVDGYSLENIELEYESITNQDLVHEVESGYNAGRSLCFNHDTKLKTVVWPKESTLINETINLPRKSMKAVVMLFTEKTRAGSEEFVYPNIEKVKITVEGNPDQVFSQGLVKRRLFEEAERLFKLDPCAISASSFFTDDKFALVIDLRTIEDTNLYGHGTKLISTQSGIMLEITKKATTTDLNCHIFVLSDGVLKVQAGEFRGVSY